MTVDSSTSPIARSEFVTSNPEAAHEFLQTTYVGHRARTRGSTEDFSCRTARASAGAMSIDHLRHSMGTSCATDPPEQHIFLFPRRGFTEISAGGEEVRLAPGGSAIYPVGRSIAVDWNMLDMYVLTLPLEVLTQAAATQVDVGAGDFHFDAMTPISPAMCRYWWATVGYVHRQLVAPDSALANPLLQARATSLLVTAALNTFPNVTMTSDQTAVPHRVMPAALSRAAAYIDAHAAEPITLTDIADAAGVGARALQHAFARQHGTSPMDYLRRVRLERAHRQLQATDPTHGHTVASIARSWGFAHPGRFATAYREIYGQSPSRTLRH
ncbi:AraC family transcriptional regulator [Micromonospora sp. NPDC050397]|uniref:AraC family transcriptional regulator n=1 Tax=Micromonospora sp. NPDC050397 TaxID=3364279 RepID=UPI00384A69DC